MRIGILGAMIEEVSSIKEVMIIDKTFCIGDRFYYEGKLYDTEVVLTFSRWGKVASSSTTTTLINKFQVNFILFTGVAGAVIDSLNIGDVVVSNGLYQHDMDARPFFDQFQIPLTPTIIFEPNLKDVERGREASEYFLENINSFIDKALLNKYLISNPVVQVGMVASGDKFISNKDQYNELFLEKNGNKTLAVEMEGAAVAQVCTEHKIPYLILRTISDKADHSAKIDFQTFINDIAKKYSLEIIKIFLKGLI